MKSPPEYEYLKSLLDKLDGISGTQNEMLVEIAEIKRDLAHHIRRTDLAEENLKLIRQEAAHQNQSLSASIQPIKRHVAMMEGALKLLGVLSIVFTILKLIGIFK